MVSSVFSLLSYELPDTFIASTSQFWNYVQIPSWYDRLGDGLYVDFGVNVVDGVVWFWLLEQWRALPKELWAWKCVKIRTVGHYYNGCSIWVPSLLLFDFWEYKNNPTGFLNSRVPSVIDLQPVPSTTTPIASRLFEIFRKSGDSKSARTCRLVCRDWARECAVREPIDCNWRFEDGVVWRWVETKWLILPIKLWAWKLGAFSDEWWVERDRRQRWFLKLLQPVDSESIDRTVKYPSTLPPLSRTGTSRPPIFSIASNLPPELLKYICDAADGGSWSSRLVCRYWNRQCTPHVLRQIDVKHSPERIRALWRHRADRTLVRHLAVIENVPLYDKDSKFPWIHLLSQTCASTQSVWKEYSGGTSEITIFGPLSGGHRSMRSVHFALPRSPPRALSRGIKTLYLGDGIHFRRFEDLLHLVCELPDLEVLKCFASFGSLPTVLPRRRPHTNRNKLRKCRIGYSLGHDATPESIYTPGTLEIALYMSSYAAASFFSEAEIVPIHALLKAIRTPVFITMCYSHDHQYNSRTLDFDCNGIVLPFLALHILWDGKSHVHTTLDVSIDFRCGPSVFDKEPEGSERGYCEYWKRTDTDAEFRENTAPLRHARFVLGFHNRRQLKYFVKTVLEEDPPAIFRDATLRYGIWDNKAVEVGVKDEDGDECIGAWRRASLDSEDLTGKPTRKLLELYS